MFRWRTSLRCIAASVALLAMSFAAMRLAISFDEIAAASNAFTAATFLFAVSAGNLLGYGFRGWKGAVAGACLAGIFGIPVGVILSTAVVCGEVDTAFAMFVSLATLIVASSSSAVMLIVMNEG